MGQRARQTDASRGQMDALSMLNSVEMARMSNGDSVNARDAKHGMDEMDGIGSHMDVSSGHKGIKNIGTDANKAADMAQKVGTCRKRSKLPDSPIEAVRQCSHEPNGCGSHAEVLSTQTDVPNLGTDMQSITANARTPANKSRTIITC